MSFRKTNKLGKNREKTSAMKLSKALVLFEIKTKIWYNFIVNIIKKTKQKESFLMNNSIILSRKCEADLLNFIKVIGSGHNKVDTNFCSEMLIGMFKSSSVLLSNIVRKNDRQVHVKDGVERLSRKLNTFDCSCVFDKYLQTIRESLPERPLFLVDDSDIVKPCSFKMEGLGLVADGSDGHQLKKGYLLNEIIAVSKKGQPISVSSVLYSPKEKEFLSANTITENAILSTIEKVSDEGTFIFDRGFDDVKLHAFLLKHKQNYIIRTKTNRNVIVNGNELNVVEAAKTMKGKYNLSIKFQNGLKDNLRVSCKKICLRKMPSVPLNMVIAYGFHEDPNDPFILITNRETENKETCLQIVRDYLSRWKIEEYFKFKKQNYQLENVRIRKLKALKNLNCFLTWIIGFLGLLQQQIYSRAIIFLAEPIKEKVTFEYYRLHAGLAELLCNFKRKLNDFLYPPKLHKQYDLFHYGKYKNMINNINKSS